MWVRKENKVGEEVRRMLIGSVEVVSRRCREVTCYHRTAMCGVVRGS